MKNFWLSCAAFGMVQQGSNGQPFISGGHTLPRVPDKTLNCVVYLYSSVPDAESGISTGGSGFLIAEAREIGNDKFPFIYVVTNRHVVENGNSVVRVNTLDGKASVFEIDERSWIFHKDGDDLAIALFVFDVTKHQFCYVEPRIFLSKEILIKYNIGIGDDCYSVGRFKNIDGAQTNLPTVRWGNIAQMPIEPIVQDNGFKQESFLVEARSLDGYSGSPVFVYIPAASIRPDTPNWSDPETILCQHGPWLLGITWGYIHDWLPVCDASGRPIQSSGGSNRVKMNTGMSGVIPAWKLAELTDDSRLHHHRQQLAERFRAIRVASYASNGPTQ